MSKRTKWLLGVLAFCIVLLMISLMEGCGDQETNPLPPDESTFIGDIYTTVTCTGDRVLHGDEAGAWIYKAYSEFGHGVRVKIRDNYVVEAPFEEDSFAWNEVSMALGDAIFGWYNGKEWNYSPVPNITGAANVIMTHLDSTTAKGYRFHRYEKIFFCHKTFDDNDGVYKIIIGEIVRE